ncbi:MAG: VOC family protein [Acidimicrobiales bacterium]
MPTIRSGSRTLGPRRRAGRDDESHDEIGRVPTDGTRFPILFEPVPEKKAATNRLHLELTTTFVEDQEDTVTRLAELGARHIDVGQGPDEGHVVLADPEGNEFCVIEPDSSFLADCGRLGPITCAGVDARSGHREEGPACPVPAPAPPRRYPHPRPHRPGAQGVYERCRFKANFVAFSPHLRPSTLISEWRLTASLHSGRLGSTSAKARSAGWARWLGGKERS